jgi:prolyl-tRNA synthetase
MQYIDSVPEIVNMDKMRKYFDAPNWKMLKTVVYKLEKSGKYIAVAIRGDLDINEIKLRKFIAKKYEDTLVLASEEDLDKLGTVRGFISPLSESNLDLECF